MANIPLNKFINITHDVTTNLDTIYTVPLGTTSIVLMAQVANIGTTVETVTFQHYSFSRAKTTRVILDIKVPTNDARILLGGKLVLQTGDQLQIVGSDGGTLEFIASILETANQ